MIYILIGMISKLLGGGGLRGGFEGETRALSLDEDNAQSLGGSSPLCALTSIK